MNYKIGDNLKVLNPDKCEKYKELKEADSVKITIAHKTFYRYFILNKKGEILGWCEGCFKDEDLAPIQDEIYQK